MYSVPDLDFHSTRFVRQKLLETDVEENKSNLVTGKNFEISHSEYPAHEPSFEAGTSRIQCLTANKSPATYDLCYRPTTENALL